MNSPHFLGASSRRDLDAWLTAISHGKSACMKSPHCSGVAGHLPTYSSSSPRLSLTFAALTTLSRADYQFGWLQGPMPARRTVLPFPSGSHATPNWGAKFKLIVRIEKEPVWRA